MECSDDGSPELSARAGNENPHAGHGKREARLQPGFFLFCSEPTHGKVNTPTPSFNLTLPSARRQALTSRFPPFQPLDQTLHLRPTLRLHLDPQTSQRLLHPALHDGDIRSLYL